MSPKRLRNSDQMSVRTPLPMAILTLWFFSLSFCRASPSQSQSGEQYSANLKATRPELPLPWVCCRGSAGFRRCTASPSRCTSCSRPRTERQRTSFSGKWSYLKPATRRHEPGEHFHFSFLNVWSCGRATSLNGSRHPDEEARAVIQRQVDVEDVI